MIISPRFYRLLCRVLPACCSNDMERKGADSVAHGGADLPEFATHVLDRLETLATKAGYAEHLEHSSMAVSSRGRKETMTGQGASVRPTR